MHEAGDDAWWGRPDTDTVDAVWRLVEPNLPSELRHLASDFTARQVLTVALARCLEVGEEPPVARREKKRATFSQNHLFDAIAPRWSRTFKKVAEVGNPGCVPTPNIVNFGHGDALEVRRQLLAVGVRLKDTWDIIAGTWSKSDRSKTPGTNPFFYLTRPNAKLGYRVNLRDTEACAELRRLLPPAGDRPGQLLLDSDPWPPRREYYKVCAERPFDVVERNEEVTTVLETLERSRLRFDAEQFIADYDRWERIVDRVKAWKGRVPYKRRAPFKRRVKIGRQLQSDLDAYREIRGRVEGLPLSREGLPESVLIKSRFFRDQEGRFHADNFWPSRSSGQRIRSWVRQGYGRIPWAWVSTRHIWFADRRGEQLAGYDVSSSQTQILAVVLGLTDLEKMLKRPGFKIYRYLAEEAISWRLPLNLPSPPNPAKLMAVMKDLWVRVLYGGHLREIVRDHFDVLVPGTFPKKFTKRYNAAIETAEGDLRAFLESILWYGKPGEGKLSDFLRASEEVARVAMARDPYAGVSFIDPLAETVVRWNPPRRNRWRLNCSGFQVALKLPGGWTGKKGTPKRRFIDAIPHAVTGDYPVNLRKLKQAVAPGVIHLLDAFFNALVVRRLEHAGAADILALHDCWMTAIDRPVSYPREFEAIIAVAGREWLLGLGPVYDALDGYLEGTEYGPWVRGLREGWERRCRVERWPVFRVEPTIGVVPTRPWMTPEQLDKFEALWKRAGWLEPYVSRVKGGPGPLDG